MPAEHLNANIIQAQIEIGQIRSVFPTKGSPVEERARLNSVVREKLAEASDLAISQLTGLSHPLSRVEMIKRFRRGVPPVALLPTISLINDLCSPGLYGGNRILLDLAVDNIERYAPSAPTEEVVDVLEEFTSRIVGRDTDLLALALSLRPDAEDISQRIIEQAFTRNEGYGKDVALHMEATRKRAEIIRKRRQLKTLGIEEETIKNTASILRGVYSIDELRIRLGELRKPFDDVQLLMPVMNPLFKGDQAIREDVHKKLQEKGFPAELIDGYFAELGTNSVNLAFTLRFENTFDQNTRELFKQAAADVTLDVVKSYVGA